MAMNSFSKILKHLREKKDLLQRDLAEELDVDRTTVTKWETGKAYPDVEKLIRLADFFDVSTDFLLGREPEEQKNLHRKELLRRITL